MADTKRSKEIMVSLKEKKERVPDGCKGSPDTERSLVMNKRRLLEFSPSLFSLALIFTVCLSLFYFSVIILLVTCIWTRSLFPAKRMYHHRLGSV